MDDHRAADASLLPMATVKSNYALSKGLGEIMVWDMNPWRSGLEFSPIFFQAYDVQAKNKNKLQKQ